MLTARRARLFHDEDVVAREGRREATERAAREEVCPLERAAGVFRYDLKAAFECVIVGIG